MKFAAIPAIAAALFLLLPCTAAAQEEPEAVYAKYHQALRAGDMATVTKYATAASRSKIKPIPAGERDAMLALMKAILPQSYDIWQKDASNDGKSLTLRATGNGTNLLSEKPEAMSGVILMKKEGKDWRVEKPEWQSKDQHGLLPLDPKAKVGTLRVVPESTPKKQPAVAAAPKVAPAPKAPEPVLGKAREPCIYKPVMTSEDMERCR